jgi:aryl-alcohol dehydrogenase-like predicted oxidoreductase
VSTQNHYNLIDRRAELEVTPAAREFSLGVLPYFPLANGLLTGKYTSGHAPEDGRLTRIKPGMLKTAPWEALGQLADFARERDLTVIQVAFSWLAAQPTVASVIAGATKVEQIEQNSQAIVSLSQEDLAHIDEIFPAPNKIALF